MLTSNLLPLKPYAIPLSKQNPVSLSSRLVKKSLIRKKSISLSALDGPASSTETSSDKQDEKQNMQVVVKVMEKSRLVLKFIWMEKNIGLALDQVVPGFGTVPVTPYYFWPMEDAWDELKSKLDKPWISKKRSITLLNQATDLINLWQQSIIES